MAAITSEADSQMIATRRTSNRSSDRADEEAEHRHRQKLDERERTDGDRPSRSAASTSHDGGDLLHPRARERDRLAGEVEPVVPVFAEARERSVAERGARRLTARSAAAIGWPVTNTLSPASVTGIARMTARTPSSGAAKR